MTSLVVSHGNPKYVGNKKGDCQTMTIKHGSKIVGGLPKRVRRLGICLRLGLEGLILKG